MSNEEQQRLEKKGENEALVRELVRINDALNRLEHEQVERHRWLFGWMFTYAILLLLSMVY